MTPFQKVAFAKPSAKIIKHLKRIAKEHGRDFKKGLAPRLLDHPGELFVNDVYQVIRENAGELIHLSIRRLDQGNIRSWRDLQQIKNKLVGFENEAVDLFPAESRLVDTTSQYHLWVVADPVYRFPFGFDDGRLVLKHPPQ